MPTFNTLFKKVYEEALAPYGFVKLKGKQPYFVRLIGDEIIHVISYKSEQTGTHLKAFNILGGVATVYRGALTLELSPIRNSVWMAQNNHIYGALHPYETEEEKSYRISIMQFEYEKDNEASMLDALYKSFEVTKKVMLPEMDKARDLKSALEYTDMFTANALHMLYMKEEFWQKRFGYEYKESLLQIKVYSTEEYVEMRKEEQEKYFKKTLHDIEIGKNGMTKEELEWEREEGKIYLQEDIEQFQFLMNDPEQYARIMQELERRKAENTQRLREYGFEV